VAGVWSHRRSAASSAADSVRTAGVVLAVESHQNREQGRDNQRDGPHQVEVDPGGSQQPKAHFCVDDSGDQASDGYVGCGVGECRCQSLEWAG